jgi:hypothetical protein
MLAQPARTQVNIAAQRRVSHPVAEFRLLMACGMAFVSGNSPCASTARTAT